MIGFPLTFFAQENFPLNFDNSLSTQYFLNKTNNSLFTAMKPASLGFVESLSFADSVNIPGVNIKKKKISWFRRKVFYEDFVRVSSGDFRLYINPLFNFSFGHELEDKNLYHNGRGLQIKAYFGKKLFVESRYFENQALFPGYISDFISSHEVAPGQGRVKNFKDRGYDFSSATALISYSPSKNCNLQLGYDKNFIGDGYRSLLLSDNAFQYPFLKIYFNYKWFYYQSIYTVLQNLNTPSVLNVSAAWYHGYQNKAANFHFAGFRINKKLDFGLFEGTIFQSITKQNPQHFTQFIPLIFFNAAQYSFNDENNVVAGMTLNYKPIRTLHFYGQLMVDNLKMNRIFTRGYIGNTGGFQLGIKYFNVFKLKNLHFQLEYNQVSPYSYMHEDRLQSYSHYNQALAHPLGANFREVLFFVHYRLKRLFVSLQGMYAQTGVDANFSNWGQNIFLSKTSASRGYNSDNNVIGQGNKKNILFFKLKGAWIMNPKTNLQLFSEISFRQQSGSIEKKQSLVFLFGIKTALTNVYHDF